MFKKIANYINQDLMGFYTTGLIGGGFYTPDFHVYRDSRGIVTFSYSSKGKTKMDEKWPSIKALRFIVPDIKS